MGAQDPNFTTLVTGQAVLSPAQAHSFSRYGPPKICLFVCQLQDSVSYGCILPNKLCHDCIGCLSGPDKASALQAAPVRYKVAAVVPGDCEKLLVVRDEATSRDITVHLLDGWMDTPAEAGDVVHVLADVIRRSPDEMGHATCSASSGRLPLAPVHGVPCKRMMSQYTALRCLSKHRCSEAALNEGEEASNS